MFFLIFCLCHKTQAKLKPIINTRTRFSFIILRCWRFPWPFLVPQTFLPFDAAKASLVEYHSHTENRPLANTHSQTHTHTHSSTLEYLNCSRFSLVPCIFSFIFAIFIFPAVCCTCCFFGSGFGVIFSFFFCHFNFCCFLVWP